MSASTPIISAFELYFILKLDDFRQFFDMLSLFGGIGVVLVCICCIACFIKNDCEGTDHKYPTRFFKFLIPILVIPLLIRATLPSTKQMAVIAIVPKIATYENLDTVSKESKELYELAKDYFRGEGKEKVKEVIKDAAKEAK